MGIDDEIDFEDLSLDSDLLDNGKDERVVTDEPVEEDSSASSIFSETTKESGSGTQVDYSPGSLSGIHRRLLEDIKEPRIDIDLLVKSKKDLETLPLYILSGSQSPVIISLERDYIHAHLPLSCLDYGEDWPDEEETLRQEIRAAKTLQELTNMIHDKESQLLEIIGQATEEYMQDFYIKTAANRSKEEARCKTNRRRKNRKQPEPNLGNTAITEKRIYRRFNLLRTDIEEFLEQVKKYGLVEIGALPYKTYRGLNLETGKVEDIHPSYKRFAFGFPEEEDILPL